ncbi:DNA polymerase [Rhizobium rhizogenes]
MTRPSAIGRNLGGDIESNGLLRATGGIAAMTTTHCIGFQDMDNGEEFYFGPAVPEDHPMWEVYPDDQATRKLLASPSSISVGDGIEFAQEANMLVFHNGRNFDYRAMAKFYGFKTHAKCYDSFVMAQIIWPGEVLLGPDLVRARQNKFPMQLLKSHSLKAWGYRLGDLKDEYDGDRTKYPEPSDRPAKKGDERYDRRWEEWNPWMARYMMQDNRPMVKLWRLIEKRIGWREPEKADVVWPEFVLEYEHEYATIVAEQEDFGVRFDIEKARKLEAELLNLKAKLGRKLEDTFGSWWHAGDVVTPKAERAMKRNDLPDVTIPRVGKTGKLLAPYVGPPVERYSPDAPYTPIEWVTYKASSRDHLGMRLQDVYGWKPTKFGKAKPGEQGKPTVDEATLEEIPESVLPANIRKMILDYFAANKLLGMLAVGQNAWLNLVEEDSRLHGRVNSNGTVTRRCAHSKPNLGQCYAVQMEKVTLPDGTKKEIPKHGIEGKYGYECRELFTADTQEDGHEEDWELTGVDASSLELIGLGHYLFPHDEGAFSARVCDPDRDPHQEHADMASEAGGFAVLRKDAKTTIYLKVYGGSAFKLSLDPAIVVTEDEVPELLTYRGLPMLLRSLGKRLGEDFVEKMGDMQKARLVKARKIIMALEAGIAGLVDLTKLVTEAAAKGWMKGMDGSRLHVRKAHAALNTLLQSAGAMSCKVWKVFFHRKMAAAGYVHGRDYKQVLDVHDEIQVTHKPGLGPIVKRLADEAMVEAGIILNLRGRYRTDAKHGLTWAACH